MPINELSGIEGDDYNILLNEQSAFDALMLDGNSVIRTNG
jgi:hypothetical protein